MNKLQNKLAFSAIGTVFLWATSACALNLQAQAITFTKILDLNAPIPGRPGESFGAYRFVSTDGTTVAFVGFGTLGNPIVGIYTMPITGGTITKIADTFTAAPGGGGNFVEFTRPSQVAPFVSNGKVVFYGHMADGFAAGIFSAAVTGGPITRVANYKTAIPGGPVPGCTQTKLNMFDSFLSFNLDKIAFSAATCAPNGVYTALPDGTQKRRIANNATIANYRGSGNFNYPFIDGSHVVYTAGNVFGSTGIFLGPVSATGDPDKILVTVDSLYPDGSGKKIGLFGAPRLWNRSVVFSAARDNGLWDLGGLFLTNLSAAAPRLIANTNTAVPGYSGTFAGFAGYTISGSGSRSRVVFSGNAPTIPQPQQGLFQYKGNKLTKIVGDGDTIASEQLCLLQDLSAQALSNNMLVFSGAPFGGCGTGGIFVANLGT